MAKKITNLQALVNKYKGELNEVKEKLKKSEVAITGFEPTHDDWIDYEVTKALISTYEQFLNELRTVGHNY